MTGHPEVAANGVTFELATILPKLQRLGRVVAGHAHWPFSTIEHWGISVARDGLEVNRSNQNRY